MACNCTHAHKRQKITSIATSIGSHDCKFIGSETLPALQNLSISQTASMDTTTRLVASCPPAATLEVSNLGSSQREVSSHHPVRHFCMGCEVVIAGARRSTRSTRTTRTCNFLTLVNTTAIAYWQKISPSISNSIYFTLVTPTRLPLEKQNFKTLNRQKLPRISKTSTLGNHNKTAQPAALADAHSD